MTRRSWDVTLVLVRSGSGGVVARYAHGHSKLLTHLSLIGASRSHDGHAKLSYCKVSRTYFYKTLRTDRFCSSRLLSREFVCL
jgi:hypothetical protein